jgi:hypothetical protein
MFNRDDGNSSSDSDSDIENDGRGALDESDDDGSASSSSSESGSEIESGSGSEGEDEGAVGDDSDSEEEEEDDDDEAAGDDSDESASEETPTVLTRATDALEEDQPSKPTDPSKGIAVKCSVCPGVLCLSEKSLQQHLDSKRHKKAMAKQGVGVDDDDVLVDAAAAGRKARAREAANRRADGDESDSLEGYSDGEAETHAERLARLRAQKVFARDAPVVDSDDEDGGANRREKRGGGRQRQRARATKAHRGSGTASDADPRGAKKGKPGKRQREAAKAAAALEKAKDEGEPVSRRGPTGDTRPRGNRAAKRAAEAAAAAAAKPAKRGAYDFDAGDLLAPKPTVDKMRGDLRQMKSGRGGAGRGASAGGRGGRGRGRY